MNILSQSALLVAAASFSLGLSVVARNTRNTLFLAFTFVCLMTCGWALTFFLEQVFHGGGFYKVHLLLNIWLGPTGLFFIRVLTRVRDRFSHILYRVSLIISGLLSMALYLDSGPWPILNILFKIAPGVIAIQTVQLLLIDRRLKSGMRRPPKVSTVGISPTRRQWIYAGGLFVLGMSVMDHFPGLGVVIPAIGNLALAVYLFFLSQAISQQRFLNFGALTSRFLVLVLVAFTLTGLYSLLFAWVQDSPAFFFLNSFVVAFLILMLLDPIRAVVTYATQRLLTQEHRKLQQTLKEAQRALTGVVGSEKLFERLIQTVEQVLSPRRIRIYVLNAEGTQYSQVRAYYGTPHSIHHLLADNPFVKQCLGLHRRGELPILLDQVFESEIDRSTSRTQRQSLSELLEALKGIEANLLIPLIESDRVLALVAMDVVSPPEPWGNSWGLLRTIYPYFEQCARTLQGLEIYRQQREKERLAALGEMAAGLAHEIRNPLGAIKGAAQFLDPTADRPESRFLKIILEEVDRLNRVVTQFLDYSKPNPESFEPVELTELVRKMLELLRAGLPAGVALDLNVGTEPLWIRGSRVQIQQVLINLVQNSLNAIEGRERGQVRVRVRSAGQAVPSQVVLEVEDNGRGIKEEDRDNLFIPFFTTSPGGTGLGLSICQKIVQAHGGRIEVQSQWQQFAKFTVYLPRVAEAESL